VRDEPQGVRLRGALAELGRVAGLAAGSDTKHPQVLQRAAEWARLAGAARITS
jgi:hypothetical protein